jgi:hypothetical protein
MATILKPIPDLHALGHHPARKSQFRISTGGLGIKVSSAHWLICDENLKSEITDMLL